MKAGEKECPHFLKKYYSSLRTSEELYEKLVSINVNVKTVLLDAGCGKESIVIKYKSDIKLSVGIDILFESIQQNKMLDSRIVGKLEELPFKKESFDIILFRYVMEHLPNPDLVFKEFNFILKKRGKIIIQTSSIYNPMMFLSAILPLRIRKAIKKRHFSIACDTFPTYYKCNSIRTLNKLMQRAGFVKEFIQYAGDVVTFAYISKVLFKIFLIYEWITDIKWLRFLKMQLVASYIKK